MAKEKPKNLVDQVKELNPDNPIAGMIEMMKQGEQQVQEEEKRQAREARRRVEQKLQERKDLLASRQRNQEMRDNMIALQKEWLEKLKGKEKISAEATIGLETFGKVAEKLEGMIKNATAEIEAIEKEPGMDEAIKENEIETRSNEKLSRVEAAENELVDFFVDAPEAQDWFVKEIEPEFIKRRRLLEEEVKKAMKEKFDLSKALQAERGKEPWWNKKAKKAWKDRVAKMETQITTLNEDQKHAEEGVSALLAKEKNLQDEFWRLVKALQGALTVCYKSDQNVEAVFLATHLYVKKVAGGLELDLKKFLKFKTEQLSNSA